MSDTPETDMCNEFASNELFEAYPIMITLARKLERERNLFIDQLHDAVVKRDEAINALREAMETIDELEQFTHSVRLSTTVRQRWMEIVNRKGKHEILR